MLDVLQVITDNDRRGAQVFALDLQDELSRKGWSVETIAVGPSTNQALLPVEVIGTTHRSVPTLRALAKRCRDARVVVGHGGSTLHIAGAAAKIAGRPHIYRQISDFDFWSRTPARRARTIAGMKMADSVVALWEGQANLLERSFGVDRSKMALAPNGVVLDRFPRPTAEQRSEARSRFGITGDRPVGVYVGALVPEKGVGVAMRAVERAGMELLVVGDGFDRGRLYRQADAIGPQVQMLGCLSDPLPAYWAADFAVLMSRGGDSMPAMLIEAGLTGLPAVSTPIDGIVDIVIDGQTGLIVDTDDESGAAKAFEKVVADADRLGDGGHNRCSERYGMRLVGDLWTDVLRPFVEA